MPLWGDVNKVLPQGLEEIIHVVKEFSLIVMHICVLLQIILLVEGGWIGIFFFFSSM